MKQFPYDFFLSHRIGDNAHELRDQLVSCGCSVWFDENRPLMDRQLFTSIREAHAESRVTIAYLSPDHSPSPWTLLEMLAALRREQQFGIRCLFFYGSAQAFECSRAWSLPEELSSALAELDRRLDTQVPLFASRLSTLNREMMAHSSRTPLSQKRCVARLRRSISGYRRRADGDADLPLSPELAGDITARLMDSHRLHVASIALDWMEGDVIEPDFESLCFSLRELERFLSEAAVDRTHADIALLSALSSCLMGAERVDTRAEGMYLLATLSSGAGKRRSNRLLKWGLKREPDWSLLRLFAPQNNGFGSQAWPEELPGLEASMLQSDEVPPREALAYVGPDVRMRLDTHREMDSHDLPLEYRIELELHWLRILAAQVRDAVQKHTKLNTFAARSRLKTIDAELAHRKLNALLVQGTATATPSELEDLLERIMCVENDLIETSECCEGAPLTSFASYFIDHLLPILALGILAGRQPQDFNRLGTRCCQILSSYTQTNPQELEAYVVYWSTCARWRDAHGPGVAEHLLRSSVNGFSARLRVF